MGAQDVPTRLRVRDEEDYFAFSFFLILGIWILGIALDEYNDPARIIEYKNEAQVAFVAAVGSLPLIAIGLRFLRRGIKADSDGVTVLKYFRTYRFPWRQLEDIDTYIQDGREWFGLLFVLSDRESVQSTGPIREHRSELDLIRSQLLEMRAASVRANPSTRSVGIDDGGIAPTGVHLDPPAYRDSRAEFVPGDPEAPSNKRGKQSDILGPRFIAFLGFILGFATLGFDDYYPIAVGLAALSGLTLAAVGEFMLRRSIKADSRLLAMREVAARQAEHEVGRSDDGKIAPTGVDHKPPAYRDSRDDAAGAVDDTPQG